MSYEIEDEVDWSDGTLDPSPPKTENDSGCVSPVVHDVHDVEHLFEPQVQAEYSIPHGTTLPSSTRLISSFRSIVNHHQLLLVLP
jgi:hypothetical protein